MVKREDVDRPDRQSVLVDLYLSGAEVACFGGWKVRSVPSRRGRSIRQLLVLTCATKESTFS